ncbi:alkaline phosphatase [Psychrosphaera ytuae]|nr:alkaline phosphatase [Psychrosphaera ytuae]
MNTNLLKTIGACGVLALSLFSASTLADKPAKNIIFMIGDGMGVAQTTAYRYYADNKNTKAVETTIFDELLVGTASTYPDDNTYVTDSAASATALSSGIKSYNGAIGVDTNKKPVETLLERAKKLGKTTAIIASSQINHATPASFMAHNESRKNYDAIADAYIDETINGKIKADLMLGGGTRYFIRDDRNLVEELKAKGFTYVDSFDALNQLNTLPAIGLFAPVGLPFAVDNKALPNRVETMTKKALSLLKQDNNPNGFFVMIEGSQIDWCSHANDIACAMGEMSDFAKAIEYAHKFTQEHGDTLLIITADHTTGGLSIGSNGTYDWKPEKVKQIKHSLEKILTTMVSLEKSTTTEEIKTLWSELVGLPLSEKDLTNLKESLNSPLKQAKMQKVVKSIINDATFTGWTTSGHSAEDVQVFASGVNKSLFTGQQDNTDIAKKLFLQLSPSK